jgi:glycosyltransferase involved in cell wall biosynthesis
LVAFRFRSVEIQMTRNTTVSVVIPTCGNPELVTRAVRSALAQTFEDLEVIVVVDGPEPATQDALAALCDKRIKVVSLSQSIGAGAARNVGVKSARGDWIALLDDDDEWLPRKTEVQMERALGSRFRFPIVGSQLFARTPRYELVWPRVGPSKPLSEYLLTRDSWSFGDGLLSAITLLFPKDLCTEIPFRPSLKRYQDFDWVLRAAMHEGAGIEFLPEPLAIWHQPEHPAAITPGTNWHASLDWIESVRSIITARAYASFLATQIAPQAAIERDWAAFPLLLQRILTMGKPNSRDLIRFFGIWSVPRRLAPTVRRRMK